MGSVIIAVAATNVALAVFFKLRERWDDAFWKRVGCALLLAAAVSGMHWTAATGTYYTPVAGAPNSSSAKWTVIVVAVIVSPNVGLCLMVVVYVVCILDGVWISCWATGKNEERSGAESCACLRNFRP